MAVEDWEWLVPFRGRNHSGATEQNFLCKSGNVYVMDNHRSALWCWSRELDLNQAHSLIHIDRHTDALGSNLDLLLKYMPNLSVDIDVYLDATFPSGCGPCPVIRWDNYVSIYLRQFAEKIHSLIFLTHDDGDLPDFEGTLFSQIWELPENLSFWLSQGKAPWIVNIDLDYFFCDTGARPQLMVSNYFLDEVFGGLKVAMERGFVGVVTICLTPDSFTAGWAAAEALAAQILGILGLDFTLPKADEE